LAWSYGAIVPDVESDPRDPDPWKSLTGRQGFRRDPNGMNPSCVYSGGNATIVYH